MTVRALFLWHLHQPEYRDPVSGQPLLPWVRLHATRSYTDMAVALEKHPAARGVANWAPSLLRQLEAYAGGTAVDRDEELARKPADALSPEERAHVVRESFSVDWELWVKPVPRYAELLALRGTDLRRADLLRLQEAFTVEDLRDLQVHFLLAWMGFTAREDPLVRELLAKGRGFSDGERLLLLETQRRIAQGVLPRWRRLQEAGQVEITCSPLYHPILPLLVDSDCARRAMPDATLPPRFVHPEDARAQIVRGLDVAERVFGRRPRGMWPSEGSVSPEVLGLLGEAGVRFCATDQGILERSEREPAPDGPLHHAPWRSGDVALFFRDRDLSDAIGFRYARSDASAAADELLRRIGSAQDGATVTLALDGENPWEHYPRSGQDFLDALYTGLDRNRSGVVATLPSDELARAAPTRRIRKLHSGSWIDSNFRIWIGHPEDNQAWGLLGEARARLEAAEREGKVSAEALERAREAVFAAEGSDWFWWYGDDFTTENAPEFDALFRRNVAQVYRHLGLAVPARLGTPIIAPQKDRTQTQAVLVQPRALVEPKVDGFAHGWFEWAGAGLYRPGSTVGGSMYQGEGALAQLWFGFSVQQLFLRLDPLRGALSGQLQLSLVRERPAGALAWEPQAPGPREELSLHLALDPSGAPQPVLDPRGNAVGEGRCGAIVELSLSLDRLGLAPGDSVGLLVRVLREEVELDRLPRYGELSLSVPDRTFARTHWQV